MSKFIMMVGLPGCGKSTYAKAYNNTVVVSSDALRIKLGFDPGCGNSVVFTEMMKLSKDALMSGKDVIYDATNLSRKNRIPTLTEIKKYCDRRECVLFVEPVNVCMERNRQRKGIAVVPDHIITNMLKSFNVPMECEGFDAIKIIQTTNVPVTFSDLLEKTKGFAQDNSHHSLNLYQHLMKTKEHLPENLHEAGLYHDLGKLYTKSFLNANGIETEEAHYYNHENVGAYLYLVVAGSDANLETASLINWHMRPYIEMREEKRQREYEMLGEDFVKKLMILHEADSLAH